MLGVKTAKAQDAPLNQVHVQPPAATPAKDAAKDKEPPPLEGKKALSARQGERIRVDVNLVLVPVTVTDPLNRLVTGLDKENFFLYENNAQEKIKTFSCEDAPVSIGVETIVATPEKPCGVAMGLGTVAV